MQEDCEVFIVTGDLDTLQLVNHAYKIYTMRKGISDTAVYDAKAVRERYGLLRTRWWTTRLCAATLRDNIPGVKGIGEKTARN